VPYTDLIVLGKIGGECDFFARNWHGIHVPASTLSYPAQLAASAAASLRSTIEEVFSA
jgi:hypothetical protein